MAERCSSGADHTGDLLLFAHIQLLFVALEENRCDGRAIFHASAAGLVVHCNGHCHGDGGKSGVLRVGLDIKESIASTLGPESIVPEHVSARIL